MIYKSEARRAPRAPVSATLIFTRCRGHTNDLTVLRLSRRISPHCSISLTFDYPLDKLSLKDFLDETEFVNLFGPNGREIALSEFDQRSSHLPGLIQSFHEPQISHIDTGDEQSVRHVHGRRYPLSFAFAEPLLNDLYINEGKERVNS